MKKRILSGMRPTGRLHLGHLVGALNNWVSLQEKYDCFFMAADWHALMSEYENPAQIQDNTLDNIIDWLACGISPEKSVIFIQSQIPQHLELEMVFSVLTPLGWLERNPTYKEQLREVEGRDLSTYGFLGYPVLQAADILLYKADCVPVGEDQLPHLELTREITRRFNNMYKTNLFPEPEALLTTMPRLRGLDGRKMSKSYNNFISLSEEPSNVRAKVQGMFTDPLRVKKSDPGHPETCNVHRYYELFAPERKQEIDRLCKEARIGCTDCKRELSEKIISFLKPIQDKRTQIASDRQLLSSVLQRGREAAHAVALQTMNEVKRLLHMVYEL